MVCDLRGSLVYACCFEVFFLLVVACALAVVEASVFLSFFGVGAGA